MDRRFDLPCEENTALIGASAMGRAGQGQEDSPPTERPDRLGPPSSCSCLRVWLQGYPRVYALNFQRGRAAT